MTIEGPFITNADYLGISVYLHGQGNLDYRSVAHQIEQALGDVPAHDISIQLDESAGGKEQA